MPWMLRRWFLPFRLLTNDIPSQPSSSCAHPTTTTPLSVCAYQLRSELLAFPLPLWCGPMNLHLAENRPAVAPGYHIAGWHLSHHLAMPPNITLVPLPVKCPSSIRRKHLAIHARQLALQPRAIGSDRENLLGAGRGHTLVLTVATLSFRG
jgi:hypothetical protein